MRKLRQICLIAALIFTFTFPVYADEIECPGIAASSQAGNDNIPANNVMANVLLLIVALV